MEITKSEIRQVYGILGRLGIREMKEDVVLGATDGRTSSVRELSRGEVAALIARLSEADPAQAGGTERVAMQRRRIMSICYQLPSHLGFTRYDASKERHVIDTVRLDAFLCGPKSIFKKQLNRHTSKELSKVITQFENMLKGYLK